MSVLCSQLVSAALKWQKNPQTIIAGLKDHQVTEIHHVGDINACTSVVGDPCHSC